MVSPTTLITLAVLALAACKGKSEPAKQPPPKAPVKRGADALIERLPELAEGGTQLVLEQASGIVAIAADGSVSVGTSSDLKETSMDRLEAALGLTPVQPRQDTLVDNSTAGLENPTDVMFAKLGHPALASGAPAPAKRLTSAFAIAHPNDVSGGVVVLADANAPAATLVDVLSKVGGFVAVRNGKKLAALPLALDRHAPAAMNPTQRWPEVRLGKSIEVEAVPSRPTAVPALNMLASAVGEYKTDAIDVLVGPDTKVQDLINTIRELRVAKVAAIGFGHAPAAGGPDTTARGELGRRVLAWNYALTSADRFDQTPFRAAFDATLPAMKDCYVASLAKKATKAAPIAETAQVSFVVAPNQQLSAIKTTEVGAPLVKCVGDALRAAKFPSPGTQPVQIDARITFAPD